MCPTQCSYPEAEEPDAHVADAGHGGEDEIEHQQPEHDVVQGEHLHTSPHRDVQSNLC